MEVVFQTGIEKKSIKNFYFTFWVDLHGHLEKFGGKCEVNRIFEKGPTSHLWSIYMDIEAIFRKSVKYFTFGPYLGLFSTKV